MKTNQNPEVLEIAKQPCGVCGEQACECDARYRAGKCPAKGCGGDMVGHHYHQMGVCSKCGWHFPFDD